jgi:hypothetical protein
MHENLGRLLPTGLDRPRRQAANAASAEKIKRAPLKAR